MFAARANISADTEETDMRWNRVAGAAIAVLLICASVLGEDSARAPERPTFATVPVRPDELPARTVDGLRCASAAARDSYADPGFAGSLDCPPVRKRPDFQAVLAT